MIIQDYFNYKFFEKNDENNFFVNSTNQNAYDLITNNLSNYNILLYGPKKSGKSHLANIWKKKNNALIFDGNLDRLINKKNNVVIEDILNNKSEEEIFHLINHCNSLNLKILATSNIELNNYLFHLNDLSSRLKTFYYVEINQPDDQMCKMLMTKLFSEKQIIIKNKEIFDFIFNRVNRTYLDLYNLVEKIDKFSLQKKKQLTIPLIREII